MRRRDFLRSGTLLVGAWGTSVALSLGGDCFVRSAMAQSRRKENWVAPSSITPLQCYVVIAKEKGFFEAEGLDLSIQATPGTASAVTQLVSGGAMFAQSAAITTVPAIANQNAEIITVGQVIYRSVFELASPASKPLKSAADWEGKTIGLMSVGGSTDHLLNAMTVGGGGDPKKVKKVVTGMSAGAYAFMERGQVDGFFSYYPMRIALDARGINLHYLNTDDLAPIPPDNIIVSKASLRSEADRRAVVSYLRACGKAMQFLLDPANYDDATAMMAKYNPVEAQDRALARKKFEFVANLAKRPANVPFMHCDDSAWKRGVEVLESIGMVQPNAKALSEYYTNDLVRMI